MFNDKVAASCPRAALALALVALCWPMALWTRASASEVASLERELHRAVRAGIPDTAIDRLKDLARVGSAAAYRAIIRRGLSGTNYDVEKYAGNLLVNAPSSEVRALILSEATSNRNYRTRIVLLAVAARWAKSEYEATASGGGVSRLGAASLQVLHDALRDPSSPVRFSAVRWIRRTARKESIGPLVARLEEREGERRDRFYYDLVKALKSLSGRQLDLAAEWRSWWESAKDSERFAATPQRLKPERNSKSKSKTVLYKAPPTFFSVPVDSDRVLFVIDVSTSMLKRDPELPPEVSAELVVGAGLKAGSSATAVVEDVETAAGSLCDGLDSGAPSLERERLHRVKEELIAVIAALPEGTLFGILSFSHQLGAFADHLQRATPAVKGAAFDWVRNLRAFGTTRTDLALLEALSVSDVDTVYMLTDGQPRDEANRKIPVEPILAMVRRENRFQKRRIHTISFEQVRNRDMRHFVKQLAKQNDGVCTLLR